MKKTKRRGFRMRRDDARHMTYGSVMATGDQTIALGPGSGDGTDVSLSGGGKKEETRRKKNGAKRSSFSSPSEPSLSLLASLFIPTHGCCLCFGKKADSSRTEGHLYTCLPRPGEDKSTLSRSRVFATHGGEKKRRRGDPQLQLSHMMIHPADRPVGVPACLPASRSSLRCIGQKKASLLSCRSAPPQPSEMLR